MSSALVQVGTQARVVAGRRGDEVSPPRNTNSDRKPEERIKRWGGGWKRREEKKRVIANVAFADVSATKAEPRVGTRRHARFGLKRLVTHSHSCSVYILSPPPPLSGQRERKLTSSRRTAREKRKKRSLTIIPNYYPHTYFSPATPRGLRFYRPTRRGAQDHTQTHTRTRSYISACRRGHGPLATLLTH
ncbi:hypothetical protein LZ30DRAFT_401008 [Colletotrichum cereale]|nr:hypothetical protein LZ30DRAFT_401008 [Colletotrichum cereale]